MSLLLLEHNNMQQQQQHKQPCLLFAARDRGSTALCLASEHGGSSSVSELVDSSLEVDGTSGVAKLVAARGHTGLGQRGLQWRGSVF